MDRGRRAEPYSNATIWTREIARNLAGHLSRVSKAHSCVDTTSPKCIKLPQFHLQKRCPTSPMKTRQHFPAVQVTDNNRELDFRTFGGCSAREESENTAISIQKLGSTGKKSFAKRKIKSIVVQPLVKDEAANQEDRELQRQTFHELPPAKQHRLVKLNGSVATYDTPLVLPHHKNRLPNDYSRRQEQIKIWQENQALIKRLQSTKATLNSKEWERDGKWTQEFLKNQEKRRSVLQHEMRRAQASPQAALRPKPLKALHPHHLKHRSHDSHSESNLRSTTSPIEYNAEAEISGGERSRRGSTGHVHTRRALDASSPQATAANHRRIKELRKQTPLTVAQLTFSDTVAEEPASDKPDAFIPDNEIVSVRFTFSRGRSRGSDRNTNREGQLEQVTPLEVSGSERDKMSLSGGFSPGVELESALNAASTDDEAFDEPETDQKVGDITTGGNASVEETSGTAESDTTCTVFEDIIKDTPTASFCPIGENLSGENPPNEQQEPIDSQADVVSTPMDAEELKISARDQPAEGPNDGDEDDEYDGDDFDASARDFVPVTVGVRDRNEASGYGSEFEEDTTTIVDREAADNQQDEDDVEVSYSHDDFVD